MLMKLKQSGAGVLGFTASGRLTDNDYKNFLIPQVKAAMADNERIRLLFCMDDFRGWDVEAAWDDLVFGLEINRHVEKVAIVGERNWDRWVARVVRLFTRGEVRYFDVGSLEQAWAWLRE